jgi:hypothetical protein
MVWYMEADYDRLLTIFTDAHLLPRTFLQWQDKAEQGRKRYLREGKIVIKAHIDPDTFPAWCLANGAELNASGRMKFANAEAYRVVTEKNMHGGIS